MNSGEKEPHKTDRSSSIEGISSQRRIRWCMACRSVIFAHDKRGNCHYCGLPYIDDGKKKTKVRKRRIDKDFKTIVHWVFALLTLLVSFFLMFFLIKNDTFIFHENKPIIINNDNICMLGWGTYYLEFENKTIIISDDDMIQLCETIKDSNLNMDHNYRFPVKIRLIKTLKIKADDSCEKTKCTLIPIDKKKEINFNDEKQYNKYLKEKKKIAPEQKLYISPNKGDTQIYFQYGKDTELIPCDYSRNEEGFWLAFYIDLGSKQRKIWMKDDKYE